jgi:hypothetical protein
MEAAVIAQRADFAAFVAANNAKVVVVSKSASKNGSLIKVAAVVAGQPAAYYVGYSS